MSSIFLCHNSNDKEFVRRLSNDLRALGIQVWLDEAELLVGDSLISKISEAIETFEFLIACISPNSIKSKWVTYELDLAMTLDIEGKKVKVLPMLLPGLKESDIPTKIKHKVYLDARVETNYRIAIENIIKRVKPISDKRISDHLNNLWSIKCPNCAKANERGSFLCSFCKYDFLKMFTKDDPYECPKCHSIRDLLFVNHCNKCGYELKKSIYLFPVLINNQESNNNSNLRIHSFIDKRYILCDNNVDIYLFDLKSVDIVANLPIGADEILAIRESSGCENYNIEICFNKLETTYYYQVKLNFVWDSYSKIPEFKIFKQFQPKVGWGCSAAFPDLLSIVYIGNHSGKICIVERSSGEVYAKIDTRIEKDAEFHSIDCIAHNYDDPEVICVASDDDIVASLWAMNGDFLGKAFIEAEPKDCQFIGRNHWGKVALLFQNKILIYNTGIGLGVNSSFNLIDTIESRKRFNAFLFDVDGTMVSGNEFGTVEIWKRENNSYSLYKSIVSNLSSINSIHRANKEIVIASSNGEIAILNI